MILAQTFFRCSKMRISGPSWSVSAGGEGAAPNVLGAKLHAIHDILFSPRKSSPDIILELRNGLCIQAHRSMLGMTGSGFRKIFQNDDSDITVLPVRSLRAGIQSLKAFVEFVYCGDIRAGTLEGADADDLADLAADFGVQGLHQWLSEREALREKNVPPSELDCDSKNSSLRERQKPQKSTQQDTASCEQRLSSKADSSMAHEDDMESNKKRKRAEQQLQDKKIVMALDLGSSSARAMAFSVTEEGDVLPLMRSDGKGQVRYYISLFGCCVSKSAFCANVCVYMSVCRHACNIPLHV
jgi:hypothetical protein